MPPMMVVRRAGRLLIAPLFVIAGADVMINPERRAALSAPFLERLRRIVPALPRDDVLLVRANAGLHLVAGSLLVVGRVPRLASLALAVSLVPTTLGGHRFWDLEDPAQRAQQRSHLLKNLAILGGLLVVVGQSEPPAPARSAV